MSATPRGDSRIYSTWGAVKALSLVAITAVLCYKLIVTPFDFKVDFQALLSLLLAIFSVGLAALFYFKATETSNTFYDNTYKFTTEIANLLARIESGFGERLRHLDEGYTRLGSYFEAHPAAANLKSVNEEMGREQQDLERTEKEREELIATLLSRAKLQDKERAVFLAGLKEKDEELVAKSRELELLRHKRREAESMARPRAGRCPNFLEMQKYLRGTLGDLWQKESTTDNIQRTFSSQAADMHPDFLNDMFLAGFMKPSSLTLTPLGLQFVREALHTR